MKIDIEIADDSKLIEILAAEISRVRKFKTSKAAASTGDETQFTLSRAGVSQLTCIVVSCGT